MGFSASLTDYIVVRQAGNANGLMRFFYPYETYHSPSLKRAPTRLAMVPDAAIRELTRPREVVRSAKLSRERLRGHWHCALIRCSFTYTNLIV